MTDHDARQAARNAQRKVAPLRAAASRVSKDRQPDTEEQGPGTPPATRAGALDFEGGKALTDPVIPPAAIEAAAKAILGVERSWGSAAMWDAAMRDARLALAAALPHIRPLVEVATQVGLELGRQEAADEIAAKCLRRAQLAERVPEGERSGVREGMVLTWLEAERLAREVATRTADARTDPSGHTDLPPTPDAGSNRLPEEGDEWCCGTCQRIAWEANPMSQSTGETP